MEYRRRDHDMWLLLHDQVVIVCDSHLMPRHVLTRWCLQDGEIKGLRVGLSRDPKDQPDAGHTGCFAMALMVTSCSLRVLGSRLIRRLLR